MSQRHPEWARIAELMAAGSPVELAIAGTPAARLRLRPALPSISLEIGGGNPRRALPPVPDAVAVSRVVGVDGGSALSVSTSQRDVFAPFYSLITATADEVQLARRPPEEALADAIEAFRRLLSVEPPTSVAKQAGLFGELLLLLAHMRAVGPVGADAWVGPTGAPHDLRLDEADVEVKTTTTGSRVHSIASLGQLEPLPQRPLFLVSIGIQEAPLAASSRSVADLVADIRLLLSASPLTASRFERTLALTGWDDHLHAPTALRFINRDQPAAVGIEGGFPRIVRPDLDAWLGSDASRRILRVEYSIDLAGLVQPFSATPLVDRFTWEP